MDEQDEKKGSKDEWKKKGLKEGRKQGIGWKEGKDGRAEKFL